MNLRAAAVAAGIGLVIAATAGAEPSLSGVPPDTVRALVARLAPQVEDLRGRRFRHPVPVEVQSDAGAAAHFAARIDQFLPAERRRAWEAAHAALGLLPRDTDLQSLLLGVLEEQVGGYYDPARDAFVLLGDMPAAALAPLAVHELTHALDDQHCDIDSVLSAASDDDDRAAAFAAVVEGSGMDVMARWLQRESAAGRLDPAMQSGIAESEAGRANRLQEAPDVVVRSLLGSYIAGWLFLASGGGDSAAANIDHAFRDPPLSTEQILHPEKYWDPDALDLPRDVPLPDLAAVAGSGWTRVGSGVFGELELVALVAPPLDVANIALSGGAAFTAPETSGWDGDRWAVFEHQGRVAVVWASVWDNPHDAAEFAAAANFPDSVHVEHRGDAVVALDGIEPSLRAPVAAACFALLAPAPGR